MEGVGKGWLGSGHGQVVEWQREKEKGLLKSLLTRCGIQNCEEKWTSRELLPEILMASVDILGDSTGG
jgi:hypothetical protein